MKTLLKPFAGLATVWIRLDEFKKARWKLTGIYILILFVLFNVFTGALFFALEKEEHIHTQNIETQWRKKQFVFSDKSITVLELQPYYSVAFSKEEILYMQGILLGVVRKWILIIEFIIILLAGFLSHFFAGRTLLPIQKKAEKQKQFLADVSHELKNPLSALKTSLEITKEQDDLSIKEAREIFSDLEGEVSRLEAITKDILFLERDGKKKVKQRRNIKKITEKIIHSLETTAKKRNIIIRRNLKNCSCLLKTEDAEKIIFNLLHNAIKFSHPNGKIEISLSEKGVLTIQDFGIGISAKDLPYIFDRFYKADASRTSSNENGSGLGLSIVKKIINENNCRISVESEEGNSTNAEVKFG